MKIVNNLEGHQRLKCWHRTGCYLLGVINITAFFCLSFGSGSSFVEIVFACCCCVLFCTDRQSNSRHTFKYRALFSTQNQLDFVEAYQSFVT